MFGEQGGKWIADVGNAWPVILGWAGVTLVIGYLYLFLIRCFGGFIIWISLLGAQVGLIGGGLYTYFVVRP